ncbi:hypothetical protein CEXT_668431 [Caerostris extrusa]|uniref:Uncharacterized protein n=1 Tax=Caerostris extrusa TaxID=172846 RepID=A0AAV4UBG2_CAEEX|nr:hypothetical protein CEXT_668431 [Caerostris extrusa]
MCRTSDAHSAEKSCSSEQNGDSFPQRTGSLSSTRELRGEKRSLELIKFLKLVKYLWLFWNSSPLEENQRIIHKSHWKLQDRTPLANNYCPLIEEPKSTFDFFQFICRTSDAHSAEKSCSSEQNGDLFPQRTGSLSSTRETLRIKKKKFPVN